MPILLTLMAVVCLALAAGLNPFVTFVLAGVIARADIAPLASPVGGLSDALLFEVLLPLALLAMALDKIPAVSRLFRRAGYLASPLAAAALAWSAGHAAGVSPIALALSGAAAALAVHAAKSALRPVVADTTHGIGATLMSMLEDLLAAVLTVTALLAPILSLAFAAFSGYLFYRAWRLFHARWRQRRAHAAQAPAVVAAVKVGGVPGDGPAKAPEGSQGV